MNFLFKFTAIIAIVPAALGHQNDTDQAIVTWFSTSNPLSNVSTWRVVQYGSAPATPIPTVRPNPGPPDETVIIREPTASRNINLTTTFYIAQETLPVKNIIETVTQSVFGVPTTTGNGTGTAAIWVFPTVATVTFIPTICANTSPPSATITRYTGIYTPFPGQFPSTTRTSFPTIVTSYVKLISRTHVFPYTGTTSFTTLTTTSTTYLSTITRSITTTITAIGWNPIPIFPPGYTITFYSTTLTTTTISWRLASTIIPTTISCSETATVTQDIRCAPSNLISEHTNRAVVIPWIQSAWSATISSLFGSDLLADAARDPSICCQLCLDNPGCAASQWDGSWNDGCRLYFYNTDKGGKDGTKGTCGVEEGLEVVGIWDKFPGQGSKVQVGCGRLRWGGVADPCAGCLGDKGLEV